MIGHDSLQKLAERLVLSFGTETDSGARDKAELFCYRQAKQWKADSNDYAFWIELATFIGVWYAP